MNENNFNAFDALIKFQAKGMNAEDWLTSEEGSEQQETYENHVKRLIDILPKFDFDRPDEELHYIHFKGFMDIFKTKWAIDQMIEQDHVQKTHSLDLKIKQLEERIEHLESK